ncbi:DUF986 family protein [Clostridium manihotivorum]|uniref:DUF5673 domain-containing protein n=1 Tax=Clostridium manihotivorum TaxID=2320868 RepID=A0A3R5QU27_9CLOT|nr:DUF986 family protein [Clostridium manihotivorum]QAA32541.1 hypothetical protein C1I91_13365 [Clostridium manihotivorum]
MSKWKKRLLILLSLIFLAGIIPGIVISKLETKGQSNIFKILALIFSSIAFVCLMWDIISTIMIRKDIGESKFKLVAKTKKGLKAMLLFFIILFFIELLIVIFSKDISNLPLCILMLMLVANQAFHFASENCIVENGIINWGVYHRWENIRKYKIGDNCLVEFDITKKGLGVELENRASFYCNEEEKEAVEEFLKIKCKS